VAVISCDALPVCKLVVVAVAVQTPPTEFRGADPRTWLVVASTNCTVPVGTAVAVEPGDGTATTAVSVMP